MRCLSACAPSRVRELERVAADTTAFACTWVAQVLMSGAPSLHCIKHIHTGTCVVRFCYFFRCRKNFAYILGPMSAFCCIWDFRLIFGVRTFIAPPYCTCYCTLGSVTSAEWLHFVIFCHVYICTLRSLITEWLLLNVIQPCWQAVGFQIAAWCGCSRKPNHTPSY